MAGGRRFNRGLARRKIGAGFQELEQRIVLTAGTFPGVPDVVGQFSSMQSHADALAFTLSDSAPDASISEHYQGIVRYPGDGTPAFYVTQKDEQGGFLHIVTMPTRDSDGERLGSNLQQIGTNTSNALPPASDRWIKNFRFNGSVTVDGRPLRGYVHPGGMAIVDNILFVAMDTPTGSANDAAGGQGALVLFDLGENGSRRFSPTPIQVLPLDHLADNVAVIKQSGRYFIYINGDGGKSIITYFTSSDNLRANDLSLTSKGFFNPRGIIDWTGTDWPTGAGAHQSSTFIRQSSSATPSPNAPLYMIAMRHSGTFSNPLLGDDLADLYKVSFTAEGRLNLDFIKTYHSTLRYDGAGTVGNFAAASGAYVSPSGELLIYSTPHKDVETYKVVNGEYRYDLVVDNVRIAELGNRDGVRRNSPLLRPTVSAGGSYATTEGGTVKLKATGRGANSPWVELFDDVNFEDRSIKVEYHDRALYEMSDLNRLDGFGDRTSSVRWRLPVGMSVELFDDTNFSDTKRTLVGNGQIRQISDLGSFGDKTSSFRFVGTNSADSLSYAWDLDGDGVFGETGTSAGHGNEIGATPTFRAGSLDGPTLVVVSVRIIDGTGASSIATSTINISNKPPLAAINGITSANAGQLVTYNLSATDPSFLDTLEKFTYTVDYGDGQVVTYTPPRKSLVTTLNVSHTYSRNGLYVIKVTATDRNGGVSPQVVLQVAIGPVINA